MKNIFFKDYRKEEVGYLKKSGISEEEIGKYVPETQQERYNKNKSVRNEYQQLKLDVALMKQQIKELREKLLEEKEEKNVEEDNSSEWEEGKKTTGSAEVSAAVTDETRSKLKEKD